MTYHPVLEDPALSVEVIIDLADDEDTDAVRQQVRTRGILDRSPNDDEGFSLGSQSIALDIPDVLGEDDYSAYVGGIVSVMSVGIEGYIISAVRPSGSALGSAALGWARSLRLVLQRG